MRRLVAFAAVALLGGCHKAPAASEAPPAQHTRPTLHVAATGNVWGQVEPCG